MPDTLQSFLADAALKGATDLETAFARLPADKRAWSAAGDARSGADMVAECAILTGTTASAIENRAFPSDFDFAGYVRDKDELAQDESANLAMLHANTARAAKAIRGVTNEDLNTSIQTPFGPMTLQQLMTYPSWNMTYHEAQINFIASMLGCLK